MHSPTDASPPSLRTATHGLGPIGSLLLHRIGLAPTARCRSPGALRNILYVIAIGCAPEGATGLDCTRRFAVRSAPSVDLIPRRTLATGVGLCAKSNASLACRSLKVPARSQAQE